MKTVEILLATYKPNLTFFKKLLLSLNRQTYKNISLIVRDDSGDEEEFKIVKKCVEKYITKFKYKIKRNHKNLGSNKTFELLTQESNSYYLAYCDQDDIWEKEKIEKLVKNIEDERAVLSYSDLSIINENDKLIAKSFLKVNKRVKHKKGDRLFKYFLSRNSITGCTILIKSEVAKKALPFCKQYYVHDHWLALYSSSLGKISYIPQPLIRYRLHSNNQIGASMLKNIGTLEVYYKEKVLKEKKKYDYLKKTYNFSTENKKHIKKMAEWIEIRQAFFTKKTIKTTFAMIKKINYDYQLVIFEILVNNMPKKLANKIINKLGDGSFEINHVETSNRNDNKRIDA